MEIKEKVFIGLLLLLTFFIGAITYAIIDDVADANFNYAVLSAGVSQGCQYNNETEFFDCYISSLVYFEDKLSFT